MKEVLAAIIIGIVGVLCIEMTPPYLGILILSYGVFGFLGIGYYMWWYEKYWQSYCYAQFVNMAYLTCIEGERGR
jgi:hypothetical protein